MQLNVFANVYPVILNLLYFVCYDEIYKVNFRWNSYLEDSINLLMNTLEISVPVCEEKKQL